MVWNLKPFVWFADTWEKAGDAIREAFYHRVIYGTQKYDCWYFSVMLQGFDTVFQNWRQIFYPSKLFWPSAFLVLNFILQNNTTTVIYQKLNFFSHFSFRNFVLIRWSKWTKELITYCLRRLLLLIRLLCREISNNTNNLRKKWFWVGSDCWNFTLLCLWGLRENWRTHFEIFPVLQKECYEFRSFPNPCNENSNTCMKRKEPSGPNFNL